MQILFNSIIFFLAYFSIQVLFYRFLKININKLSIILLFIIISVIAAFYLRSIEMIMNLISINLMNICFYIMMFPVADKGPSLTVIDLIANKKINNKKKLKFFFLKGPAAKAVVRRLKYNISSNFIKHNKGGFVVKKNTEKIIFFFSLIKKFYRLKSDA